MRLFNRRSGTEKPSQWQPKLYVLLVALLLLIAYLIAFIVKNDDRISIDFVFGSANSSPIWLIILSLAIGLVLGVLLSQLYRRRARPSRSVAERPAPER